MVDYKSDATAIYYYASSQLGGGFSKWRLDRTSRQVTFLTTISNDPFADFVPVTAMNPSDQTNFAVAASGAGGSVRFHKFPTFNTFNTQNTVVFGAGYDAITAMAYSSDGEFLYSASRNTMSNQGAVSHCNIIPTTGFPSARVSSGLNRSPLPRCKNR